MMIDEMMMLDRLKITAKTKTAAGANGFLGEPQRRKAAILKGRPQLPFMVADNPNARESGPWYRVEVTIDGFQISR